MKKNTYCYWLMASAAMGNKLSLAECRQLNAFLSQRNH